MVAEYTVTMELASPNKSSLLFYHSYPQLLQWNVLNRFVPNNPQNAVLATLDAVDIFFKFVLPQVGHFSNELLSDLYGS